MAEVSGMMLTYLWNNVARTDELQDHFQTKEFNIQGIHLHNCLSFACLNTQNIKKFWTHNHFEIKY